MKDGSHLDLLLILTVVSHSFPSNQYSKGDLFCCPYVRTGTAINERILRPKHSRVIGCEMNKDFFGAHNASISASIFAAGPKKRF